MLTSCRALPATLHHVPDAHDAEMDAIAAELEAAGILTVTTDDGTVTYALTREGKAIGRQLAMTQGEDARLDMLNELLDASPDTRPRQAAEVARWGYSASGTTGSGMGVSSPSKMKPTKSRWALPSGRTESVRSRMA
jgi:hypothetical protein